MELDKRIWIPLIGLIFAYNDGSCLLLHSDYYRYQLMCGILFLLGIFGTIY